MKLVTVTLALAISLGIGVAPSTTAVVIVEESEFANEVLWHEAVCVSESIGGTDTCVGTTSQCEVYQAEEAWQSEYGPIEIGTPGPIADELEQNCSQAKRCWSWQMWGIEGEATGGQGRITWWIECGGVRLYQCWLYNTGETCNKEAKKGSGTFGCFYTVEVEGLDWTAKCFDPVNPCVAYEAIPEGLPYDREKHVIDLRGTSVCP